MKQHHFLFIALSVICILIIPKQTFAQEVLTKVNGGATWLTGSGGIYSGDGETPSDVDVTVTDNIDFDAGTLFIDGEDNRVGIGTDNPSYNLSLSGANQQIIGMENRPSNGVGLNLLIKAGGTGGGNNFRGGNLNLYTGNATGSGGGYIKFYTPTPNNSNPSTSIVPSLKMMLTGEGNLGIGRNFNENTNTPISILHTQISGTDINPVTFEHNNGSTSAAPVVEFIKSRGSSTNKQMCVVNDELGQIKFRGYTGLFYVDGGNNQSNR